MLAAADSSIQFSLRNNKELFATEINDVTGQFEEEEKAEAEAKKLEQAENPVQEGQEVNNAPVTEATEYPSTADIPPPPPPPPPPAPVAARPTAGPLPTISGTDTALLIQESVFHNDVLSGPSHNNAASHSMNITDLLANVQSSDFAAQQISPQPMEKEPTPIYPTYHETDSAREMSHSPKHAPAETIVIMSKQDVAKEIYNFEKEEKQFSHYIKEEDDYEKSKYPEEAARECKYPGDHSRFEYPPDYKRSSGGSSSYKSTSRKHGEEYRERSSSSKHRERSLSPSKYAERYKEYSVRDYGHSMDRMFKSPEYYLSISRSSTSRSSSKESSRDRRKREEEWYQKYGYSSKYGHLPYGSHATGSHKYPESSRREYYDKEYYDKRRHDDPHYKSSDRSKSRDHALYEASKGRESTHDPYKMRDALYEASKGRESTHDPYKMRDALYEASKGRESIHDPYKMRDPAYEISKIRQSTGSDSAKFKEPPYVPSKYHEHELMKTRDRELLYRDRMKEEAYSSNMDIRERRSHLDRPYENLDRYSPGDVKLKPSKMTSPVRSPLENLHPPMPEKCDTPEKYPSPPIVPLPDEEPSSSRNHLDDLLERAISNIPRTPEDPSPVSSDKDEAPSKEESTGVMSESNMDHQARSPVKLSSPSKSLPRSPLKPIVSEIQEDLTEFEMQVRDTKVNDSSRRALIESILPKPKYCSILRETFAVPDEGSAEKSDEEANDDFKHKAIYPVADVRESVVEPTSPEDIEDFKRGADLYKGRESITPVLFHEKNQSIDFRANESDDDEPEATKGESLIRHDNQDFPVPCSPPLPPPPPAPLMQNSSSLPPSLPKLPSLPMPQSMAIPPSLQQPSPVSSAQPHSPHSPLTLQQAITHQTTVGSPRGPISPPLKAPITPPLPSHPHPTPLSLNNAGGKISNIVEDIRKASPTKPIVLFTTPKKEKVSKPHDSSDAEEGEILSDTDEPVVAQISTVMEDVQEKAKSPMPDPAVADIVNDDEIINKESEASDVQQTDQHPSPEPISKELTPQPPEPKAFVPDENFPIRSKRDLFKARFFQPDMKIDFAKPDQVTEVSDSKPDSTAASEKEDSEKTTAPPVVEAVKPNPDDNMRYSRKMRFKEVLQQHISEQENAKEQQLKESQQKDNLKEVTVPESGSGSQQSGSTVEPDVSTVSLIGKRKRFLNDYIASLESNNASTESNPPPAKSSKTEESSVEEGLPKLRIKPLSGGSYISEPLTTAASAPPPLHKASTSPDKEIVPKCIIKLGKTHWNACDTDKPEKSGKKKGRASTRANLRSREASTDSSKSEISDKPRATRSKKTRKAVKTYNVDDDEKNSDNSFEEVDSSRRSGRTRKTIKRLNL